MFDESFEAPGHWLTQPTLHGNIQATHIFPVGFSRLALNVRLFAKVVRLFDVRPGSFIPSPDWDDTKTACLQD